MPAEVEPITIVTVGQSAKARPATTRDRLEPIRSAAASRIRPAKPTAISRDSQSRSVIQTGIRSSWPAR